MSAAAASRREAEGVSDSVVRPSRPGQGIRGTYPRIAGRARWSGRRPKVRGVARNPASTRWVGGEG